MRTLFAKILVWFLATVITIAAVVATSALTYNTERQHEHGGKAALAETVGRLRSVTQGDLILASAQGRDLLSSEDRSGLIRLAKQRREWGFTLPFARRKQAIRGLEILAFLCRTRTNKHVLVYPAAPSLDIGHRGAPVLRADVGPDIARSRAARRGTPVRKGRSFGARGGRDSQPQLDRIQKEADRLNTLVGELLEVTRAEGDPANRKLEPVALDELLTGIVELSKIEAEAHGCKLSLDQRPPLTVDADPELLRRAAENVIRNAIRYSPAGAAVEIALGENGRRRSNYGARLRDRIATGSAAAPGWDSPSPAARFNCTTVRFTPRMRIPACAWRLNCPPPGRVLH